MSSVNIPITGDASSLVNATNKANAALNNLGASADKASAKVTPALGGMGGAASKAAAALGPLGGVLSKISPEAGAAASSIAGLSSAGQGLAAAGAAVGISMTSMLAVMGPVAIAAAALGAAYYVLSKDLEKVDEANTKAAASSDAATAAFVKLENMKRSITDQNLIATGRATKKELELRDALKSVTDAYAPQIKKQQEAVDAITKGNTEWMYSDTAKAKAYTEAKSKLDALNTEQGKYMQLAAQNAVMEPKSTKAKKDNAAASREQADATKELARLQALADAADAERVSRAHAQVEAILSAVDATNALTAATSQLGETEHERVAREGFERDAALKKQIAANMAVGVDTEKLEKARRDNHRYTAEQLAALDEQTAKDAIAADDEATRARMENAKLLANAVAGYAEQGLEAMSAGFEKSYQASVSTAKSLTDQLIAGDEVYTQAQKRELTRRIADQQKHAQEAFAISKAAKLAAAAITTAMAVINALNDGLEVGGPAGLVIGPAAAIAAGVAGGVQIAAIAAEQPSFHSGKSPDELQATILKKEAVLNSTAAAALGSRQIERLNNGQMQAQQPTGPAPIVLGHRVFEAGLKRSMESAGVLREALHSGAVYGHRKNRRISSV